MEAMDGRLVDLISEFNQLYTASIKPLDSILSKPMASHGLSYWQYLVLKDISKNPDITVLELNRKYSITKSATSRVISIMIRKDLITQTDEKNDRRFKKLALTRKGHDLERSIDRDVYERFSGQIEQFGVDKTQELLTLLGGFLQQVQEQRALDQQA